MKFFSEEILNQSIFEECDESEELWYQALHNYRLSLELIRGTVSKAVWEMAYNNELHDARFLGIHIQPEGTKNRPTTIEIRLQKKRIYQLRYSKVTKFELTFDESVTGIHTLGIDECIYSELLEVNESLFSHEMIFSSGAKFFVQFEKISLRR